MKKIGIWGYGIVGKSAVHYFLSKDVSIEVLDNRTLNDEELNFLSSKNIPCFSQKDLPTFLERNDCILPSPGIDLRPFSQYRHKWLSELDLFAQEFNKPII